MGAVFSGRLFLLPPPVSLLSFQGRGKTHAVLSNEGNAFFLLRETLIYRVCCFYWEKKVFLRRKNACFFARNAYLVVVLGETGIFHGKGMFSFKETVFFLYGKKNAFFHGKRVFFAENARFFLGKQGILRENAVYCGKRLPDMLLLLRKKKKIL